MIQDTKNAQFLSIINIWLLTTQILTWTQWEHKDKYSSGILNFGQLPKNVNKIIKCNVKTVNKTIKYNVKNVNKIIKYNVKNVNKIIKYNVKHVNKKLRKLNK